MRNRAGGVKFAFAVLRGELAVAFDVAGQHGFAVAQRRRSQKGRRPVIGRLDVGSRGDDLQIRRRHSPIAIARQQQHGPRIDVRAFEQAVQARDGQPT